MSNVIEATCENNVVKIAGKTVPATILSQGKASSTGVVLLDAEKATYVTSNATDLATLINTLGDVIQKIIEIATSLDAVTVTPGTAAANIALLTVMKTQLVLTKDLLK